MDAAFHALSNRTRWGIIETLAKEGELSAGGIHERINEREPISSAAISRHLRVLLAAELVTVRADWSYRIYKVNAETLTRVHQRLTRLLAIIKEQAA
jgi:DNA-binding transcriptional ArsR family regulator